MIFGASTVRDWTGQESSRTKGRPKHRLFEVPHIILKPLKTGLGSRHPGSRMKGRRPVPSADMSQAPLDIWVMPRPRPPEQTATKTSVMLDEP